MRAGTITKLVLAGTIALTTAGLSAAPAMAAGPKPAPAAKSAETGTITSAVDGGFTDALGGLGVVTGTFTPTEFVVQDGTLVANGTLHSVLTDSAGTEFGTTDAPVSLPVQTPAPASNASKASALAACNVLHLVLGPLDLNLLGLVVHLNTVVLDITAQSGAGNLLGNLLCALTGLLDGGLSLPVGLLSQLLNAILGLLAL